MGITVQAATNVLALGGEDEMVGSNDIPPAAGQLQVDLRRLEWARDSARTPWRRSRETAEWVAFPAGEMVIQTTTNAAVAHLSTMLNRLDPKLFPECVSRPQVTPAA